MYSQGPNWGFSHFQRSEEVPIAQVQPIYAQGGPRAYLLTTAEPQELTSRNVLRLVTLGQKALALGRAFDRREFY